MITHYELKTILTTVEQQRDEDTTEVSADKLNSCINKCRAHSQFRNRFDE